MTEAGSQAASKGAAPPEPARGAPRRHLGYLAAIVGTMAMLGLNFYQEPYFFDFAIARSEATNFATVRTIELYRSGDLRVEYTAQDLLKMGQSVAADPLEGLLIAMWAEGEVPGRKQISLPWLKAVHNALAARDDTHVNAPERAKADAEAAVRFAEMFRGESRTPRGECLPFEVPARCTLRVRTGLKAVVGMAVRIPLVTTNVSSLPGGKQKLEEALTEAFMHLRRMGVCSVGVPYFHIPAAGGTQFDLRESWGRLMSAVDLAATHANLKRVVFGGYEPSGGVSRSEEFADAWRQWKQTLASRRFLLAKKPQRLALVSMMAAFLNAYWRAARFNVRYALAVVMQSLSVVGIVSAANSLAAWVSVGAGFPGWLLSLLHFVGAVCYGLLLREIVSFDTKDVLKAGP